jgi:hypothetical protein
VALPEVQVVQRLEVELRAVPHLAQRDVVLLRLTVRGIRIGEVRQREQQLVALLAQLGELRLEFLELGFERAGCLTRLLELRVVRLAGARRLLDLARELVLLRPDRVDPGIQLTPSLIEAQELVELLGRASPGQRRARRLRIAADLLEVERGSAPREPLRARRSSWSTLAAASW